MPLYISCSQVYIRERDTTETGNETEGTPGCLQEGNDGEVGCTGACVGKPPPDSQGGDHSTGPWQRTGAVGEGGPAHPDDTHRGALLYQDEGLEVPICWTAVMRRRGGRGNPHRPLTFNDVYPQ